MGGGGGSRGVDFFGSEKAGTGRVLTSQPLPPSGQSCKGSLSILFFP